MDFGGSVRVFISSGKINYLFLAMFSRRRHYQEDEWVPLYRMGGPFWEWLILIDRDVSTNTQ